jgi:hypothetical protein
VNGLDRLAFGTGKVAAFCERDDKSSDVLKCGDFLDYVRKDLLFKKDATPPFLLFTLLLSII